MNEVIGLRLELGPRPDRRLVTWLIAPSAALLAALAATFVYLGDQRADAERRLAEADALLQSRRAALGEANRDPQVQKAKAADAMVRSVLSYPWGAEVATLRAIAEAPRVSVLGWKVNQETGEREILISAGSATDALNAAALVKARSASDNITAMKVLSAAPGNPNQPRLLLQSGTTARR